WSLDVLQRSFAQIFELEFGLAPDLFERAFRQTHAARHALVLDARGHIHAVAEDVVVVADDVADVDADAKGDLSVPAGHLLLNGYGARHRVDRAGEFDQEAVAGRLDDPAPVLPNGRIDDVAADGLESFERADFVGAHQPRITGNVRCQH